ncbi:YceI family protein [Zavarzinia sp.]|uniref:YceI family protein n=1 Tax=Zavarzinia sp. TaxID=2027920 RepID=UPI0035633F7A
MKPVGLCLVLCLGFVVPAGGAMASSLYRIQPATTTIGFSVDTLGMFTTNGSFTAFDGNLLLDFEQPQNSRVEVRVDTASVQVDSDEAKSMLSSSDYFDPPQFPVMRFKAISVEPAGDGKVAITGDLTIRGVTRPQILQAELTGRRYDPAERAEVADFVVSGTVDRAAFGMVADQSFVSKEVQLQISAHIKLQTAAAGN